MIKHPLYTNLFMSWREANETVEWKTKELESAMRDGRYEYALSVLITRPFRLEYLRNWWRKKSITREQLRDQLPWIWTDSEPNDTDRRWVTLFRDSTKTEGVLVSDMFNGIRYPLPDDEVLTIYRGTHYRNDKLGLAWSLSKEVAEMFSSYGRLKDQNPGWVITGEVPRGDILAYLMNRKEHEIDVDPAKVKVIDWERVTG